MQSTETSSNANAEYFNSLTSIHFKKKYFEIHHKIGSRDNAQNALRGDLGIDPAHAQTAILRIW